MAFPSDLVRRGMDCCRHLWKEGAADLLGSHRKQGKVAGNLASPLPVPAVTMWKSYLTILATEVTVIIPYETIADFSGNELSIYLGPHPFCLTAQQAGQATSCESGDCFTGQGTVVPDLATSVPPTRLGLLSHLLARKKEGEPGALGSVTGATEDLSGAPPISISLATTADLKCHRVLSRELLCLPLIALLFPLCTLPGTWSSLETLLGS